MPIYEYQCNNCHHNFDLMQKISDAPIIKCPQCLNDTVVRLISASGFQLKGNGWYATDFKNKSTTAEKSTDKPQNAKTEGVKTEASAENKSSSVNKESKD